MADIPDIPITKDKCVSYTELCRIFNEKPVKANNAKNIKLKEEQLARFRVFCQIDERQKKRQKVYTIRKKYTKKEMEKIDRKRDKEMKLLLDELKGIVQEDTIKTKLQKLEELIFKYTN